MAAHLKMRGVNVDQLLESIIAGVNRAFPQGTAVVLDGVNYDRAGFLAKLQQEAEPTRLAKRLHTELTNAIVARDEGEAALAEFVGKVVTALLYLFGSDPNLLAKFGIYPARSRRQLTVKEKMSANTKAEATRALRHTLGSRQKLALKAQGEPTIEVSLPGSGRAPAGEKGQGVAPSNGATGPQQVNGLATH